ncbi:putative Diguanylate cyclase [Rubrivivax sp. A210]|uniref:GGDEF domain-containing protein n=1 Tax=Rubrivivax sp. A210 TaxID=2772301 RepID=UPI00191A26EE|nr:diguanylate cyclase [Rubrivivax sp. A210]CAD5371717.1 putative Diguanylate cyclase [Rubrivivax sp. A210]
MPEFEWGASPAVADCDSLLELMRQAPEIVQWRTDALGRLVATNAAAMAADGPAAPWQIGLMLGELAAPADAAWLMALLAQPPSHHGPRLLNLLDACGHPYTVRGVVDVGPSGLTLSGVCTVRHEALLRDELVRRNNELSTVTRELARQGFALERTVRELQLRNDELAQANAEIDRLARTDPLTGLLNRRALEDELAREIERTRRHPAPLSVVEFDLDHFKRINDVWGHATGDRALVQVCRLLLAGIRRVDVAIRLGGEELLLVLPQTAIGAAMCIAERLREAVARLDIEGLPEHVTASVGVAALTRGESAESLLRRADQAMYRAKAAGRNRVVRAVGKARAGSAGLARGLPPTDPAAPTARAPGG